METPRVENPPRMENPPGMESPPGMENPPDGEPPRDGDPPDGEPPLSMCGRYASYWNAFLLTLTVQLSSILFRTVPSNVLNVQIMVRKGQMFQEHNPRVSHPFVFLFNDF